MRAQAVTVIA